MIDARELTNETFPTRESALAKYHNPRIRSRICPPPICKVHRPCCNMEMDGIEERIPELKYLEIEFELTEFTDGRGNFWWRYIRS